MQPYILCAQIYRNIHRNLKKCSQTKYSLCLITIMILNQFRKRKEALALFVLVYLRTDRSALMNERRGACSICVWVCVYT